MPELMFPKPRPRALEKKDRVKRKEKVEDRENTKVKERSSGQCEVREASADEGFYGAPVGFYKRRCARRASQTHHILGGTGRRGIGESAKAENKLHVCDVCHHAITNHTLQQHWTQVEDRAGTSYFVRLR